MARLNELALAPNIGPQFSRLPNEIAKEAIIYSYEWLEEITKTPKGLDQVFAYINATIKERD
jgi:hypothetical protein